MAAPLGENAYCWLQMDLLMKASLCHSLGMHADCSLLPPMNQNVLVNENFIKLLDFVCQTRPELDVIYGEVEGRISKIPKQHPNPMKLIQVSYWTSSTAALYMVHKPQAPGGREVGRGKLSSKWEIQSNSFRKVYS